MFTQPRGEGLIVKRPVIGTNGPCPVTLTLFPCVVRPGSRVMVGMMQFFQAAIVSGEASATRTNSVGQGMVQNPEILAGLIKLRKGS